ncbi:hypothetical protein BOTBODRAFT_101537 [Botryobasidium botryosum FD-172 SS1]|uniref:Elongator complex protein 4 n=1 Tax=Botryobasidium botryosum (strain FD-172 SS1) TaxID=930990 RepID=A0A067N911_BOTB1|nr:hypothetical protein BOTBODRAFT_101537 [Botryobasidium botryosum FD-172 SS1]
MSAFKRRLPKTTHPAIPGTRQNLSTPSILELSTGIPSFDDILGGGLPLGCVLLVLTPDPHAAWGDLVQKYFIAQGLAGGQGVCVVADRAEDVVQGAMWVHQGDAKGQPSGEGDADPDADGEGEGEGDAQAEDADTKVKIAWRYERMKQFQTSVPAQSTSSEYCHTFDLNKTIPPSIISGASQSGQLSTLGVAGGHDSFQTALRDIETAVSLTAPRRALRLSVPDLGGPQWGDTKPTQLFQFLYSLRVMIRTSPAAALVTLPYYLSRPSVDAGWIQKLGYLCDGCISLTSFGADPSLSSLFQTYHGSLQVHSAPSPNTLLPPSHKLSVIRGLSAASSQGSGENNLAFRCTRKRFVLETLHLDVEGGVGERRTTPRASAGASVGIEDPPPKAKGHAHDIVHNAPTESEGKGQPAAAVMSIGIEADAEAEVGKPAAVKTKKRVAFHSERPDLYDF